MFYQQQTCSIVVLNLANSAFIWIGECETRCLAACIDLLTHFKFCLHACTPVKLCLCLDLYCSYAIVFAPGREIMELTFITPKYAATRRARWWLTHCSPRLTVAPHLCATARRFGWVNTQRNVLRVLLVCFTVLVAQIKQFGTITNIVGGLSMVQSATL